MPVTNMHKRGIAGEVISKFLIVVKAFLHFGEQDI
jgi:hypothetical protein